VLYCSADIGRSLGDFSARTVLVLTAVVIFRKYSLSFTVTVRGREVERRERGEGGEREGREIQRGEGEREGRETEGRGSEGEREREG
jgi:hypothetical protein